MGLCACTLAHGGALVAGYRSLARLDGYSPFTEVKVFEYTPYSNLVSTGNICIPLFVLHTCKLHVRLMHKYMHVDAFLGLGYRDMQCFATACGPRDSSLATPPTSWNTNMVHQTHCMPAYSAALGAILRF